MTESSNKTKDKNVLSFHRKDQRLSSTFQEPLVLAKYTSSCDVQVLQKIDTGY